MTQKYGALELSQLATPSRNPAAGSQLVYVKSDGKLYTKNSSGTESLVGPSVGTEAWPVGSIFIAAVSTSPATLLGYGTWSRFGQGRVLVSQDSGQTEFDTAEETGGAKTHTLTTAELPAHSHVIQTRDYDFGSQPAGGGDTVAFGATQTTRRTTGTDNAGSGSAHNNLQPYIVVYMWKRTA